MSSDPSEDDKIMHCMLVTENGLTLMGADTPNHMEFRPGTNGSISLSGEDEAELRGYWDGLVEGATVTAPLDQSPWGDTFGMLIDKYGVSWMVNIAGKQA
jgi:PhnB protein